MQMLKKMRVCTLIVFALLGLSGAAGAQETRAGSVDVDLSSIDDGSLVDEDIDALSGPEKLKRGAAKIEQMRSVLGQTEQLLSSVRNKDGDIIKINCINEKLASMKGFVKVGEQSYISLNTAASSNDAGAAKHHYTLISVAREKVRTLAGEAGLCTGEEMRFAGSAVIDVTTPDTGDGDFELPDEAIFITDLPELTPYL